MDGWLVDESMDRWIDERMASWFKNEQTQIMGGFVDGWIDGWVGLIDGWSILVNGRRARRHTHVLITAIFSIINIHGVPYRAGDQLITASTPTAINGNHHQQGHHNVRWGVKPDHSTYTSPPQHAHHPPPTECKPLQADK